MLITSEQSLLKPLFELKEIWPFLIYGKYLVNQDNHLQF